MFIQGEFLSRNTIYKNCIQYIHCCPGEPVKLKIEIILKNKKDKNG